MWKFAPEVDGVLAGAAGDFQHVSALGENFAQYGEDGFLVFFAGFGVGFHENILSG